MFKKALSTDKAPAAIGPYSQAVEIDGWLFISGQIPLDPATGLLETGDIAKQTRRVMDNLRAILTARGRNFDSVVKTTIYLTDLADFESVNDVYASCFEAPFPARATVGVTSLPKGADVEIEAVARLVLDQEVRKQRTYKT